MTGASAGAAGAGSDLVVLLGPPGCEADAVAVALATRLGVDVRDSDVELARRAGKPAAEVLLDDGEDAFRALERDAAAAVLGPGRAVVALGSGAVLDDATRASLRDLAAQGGAVVLLDLSAEEAARRAGLNAPRPLLLGNPRAQLRAFLDARRPLYEEVATLVLPTDGATPDELAATVADLLAAQTTDGAAR